jgi:outer membrane protein OmpA-like peptidoglycan-associated protein
MEPVGDIKLDVTVLDKKTRALLENANVKLINLNTNVELNCSTTKEGKCLFTLDPETRYLVEGSKETGIENVRYLKVTSALNTRGMKGPKIIYLIIELEKVEKNVAIRLENIYYDFDKWNIRPDAATELDKLVKTLKDNPTIEIELSSHTDCRGSVNYNQVLSAKRAQSAVDYIVSQGIDKKRMIAAGYGKSRLIIKCSCDKKTGVPCTEEEHQVNRRTEFKILKF